MERDREGAEKEKTSGRSKTDKEKCFESVLLDGIKLLNTSITLHHEKKGFS